MKPTYDDAIHMMEVLGGSFVRALAELWYRADAVNKQKLELCFDEYFSRYKKMYDDHLDCVRKID